MLGLSSLFNRAGGCLNRWIHFKEAFGVESIGKYYGGGAE
jgi:hypothetical protein